MRTGTIIKCSREADEHGGGLRRVNGGWACNWCLLKEKGIEPKRAKGKQTTCPECGNVLMTKFRGGRVSIGSMSMKGRTATLKCGKCGYEKVIPNPFGGQPHDRNEIARMRLRDESRRKKEDKSGS